MADRIIARTDRPLQASNIVVALFFIATVTFLSLSPVLRASFLNIDDNTYVTQNSDITTLSWQGVKRVFSSSYVSMYIPVTMLSYSLEYRFFRLNPAAYHTTNLLLHIANCCLVFWLVLLLSGNNMPAAFFTALFFGIHPLRVESVAWIAERKDVLCALFFIGTLISYSYYKLSGRKKFYYVSFALFVFALLSKPMTVTLPFVMLLFDHYYRGRLSLTDLKEKIPFLTTAFLGGVVTLITQGSTNAISTAHSFLSNVLVAAHGILFYLWKTLVPVDLSAYYPYPAHVMTARFLLSPVLLALLILLVWKGARRSKTLLFGSVFFLITVAPVLQLVPIGDIAAADRYTYLPAIGLFFMAGTGIARLYATLLHVKKLLLLLAIGLMFCVLAGLSWERSHVWRDSVSFWQDVLKQYQFSMAYNSLATALGEQHKLQGAVDNYTEALKTASPADRLRILFNRGFTFMALHDYEKAIEDFSEIAGTDGIHVAMAYYKRGIAYAHLNKHREAYADLAKAGQSITAALAVHRQELFSPELLTLARLSETSSTPADFFNALGLAAIQEGRYEEAEVFLTQALAVTPGFLVAAYNLGNLAYERKEYGKAIEAYTKALSLDPGYYRALNNRASVYYETGEYSKAWNDVKKLAGLGHPADAGFVQDIRNALASASGAKGKN